MSFPPRGDLIIHVSATEPATAPRWPGARAGVLIAYFVNGFALTSWMSRLPAFQQDLNLDAAEMGGVLLTSALGVLVMVTVAGGFVIRFGAFATFTLATIGFVGAYVLMGVAAATASVAVLVIAQALHGAAFALTNVPMSTLAAAIEKAHGRTIIPQFHASFSIGSVFGALSGAAMGALHVSLLVNMLGLAAVTALARTLVAGLVRRCSDDVRALGAAPVEEGTPLPHTLTVKLRVGRALDSVFAVWREPRTFFLGIVVLVAALSEGAANTWVAIASVDSFGVGDAAGAAVYAVFLAAATLVRLLGGHLVDRWGRSAVLIVSGAVAIVGVALFSLGPALPLAIVGCALWGAGAALCVPLAIAAAADEQTKAPARIAAVTSMSSLANIAGPPLIGYLGDAIGLRLALLPIALALVVSIIVTRRAVTPREPR